MRSTGTTRYNTTSMAYQSGEEHDISLSEAQRRVEGMLVRQGYVTMGRWTDQWYSDDCKEPLYSMKIVGLEDTRILLWRESSLLWRCVLSMTVGSKGDLPLSGGRVERR